MTKIQIINETIEYYKTHPRAVGENGACYYERDGKMCAVGRCLENPKQFHGFGVVTTGILDDLKEQYLGHEILFWEKLQALHDCPRHWDGNKLTDEGQDALERLIERCK